ncbi:hypothetical protein N7501_001955 [Penicillium viridicatum]|nr:hypothetical protein N7501_001955 [Penicillium viridicatum]
MCVTGLCNRPWTSKDAHLPDDPRLNIVLGIDLTRSVEAVKAQLKEYEDGWYSELAANKYSECKAWMEAYDKAHAAKNERELKAKALAAEINAIRMEFSKEVLNSLLRHYVPNLHSLLKAEEPTDPAQAQAEAEDESNEPHSSPATNLFVAGFIHTFH